MADGVVWRRTRGLQRFPAGLRTFQTTGDRRNEAECRLHDGARRCLPRRPWRDMKIHFDPATSEFLRSRGDECRSRSARGSRRKMRAKYLDRDGRAGEAPIRSSRGWRLSPRVWRLRVVLRAEGLPRGLDSAGVEVPGGESRPAGCFGDKPAGKWNQCCITMTCMGTAITAACYLCNTFPETA